MPDRVIYKPCGNRRATTCPGCAETYRRDAYHLIRAGLIGGKGIPRPSPPTRPSSPPSPPRPSARSTPARSASTPAPTGPAAPAAPNPATPAATPAPASTAVPLACFTRHRRDDPRLGQPLCPDCYDYPAHVVWNNAAGELWRRTKQAIERHLGQLARRRGVPPIRVPCGNGKYRLVAPVRVSHGKAAEFQARGAVHFHVLLRLDGVDPADPDAVVPPPPGITVADLDDAIRHAAAAISLPPRRTRPSRTAGSSPGAPGRRPRHHHARHRHRHRPGRRQLPRQIRHQRHRDHRPRLRPHHRRHHRPVRRPRRHPRRTAHRRLLDTRPATRTITSLRRWAHMLGFGGHFLTKARRYSITFGDLRQVRIIYRRSQDTGPEHGPIRTADHTDEETILIIGTLRYAGTGWKTTGDALLANTAADQARKRREAGREELAHEYNRATAEHQAA